MEQEYRNGHTQLNGYEAVAGGGRLNEVAIVNGNGNGAAPPNGHTAGGHAAAVNGTASNGAAANGHAGNGATSNGAAGNGTAVRRATATEANPLQQVGDARRRQGLSVRCVAQRLNMTVGEVRAQEEPNADMPLSELYRWQSVLEVPLEELLADPQDSLSSRVLTRARMLRVMKTAQALRAQSRTESERRLSKLLISQLVEIMPELKEVAAWPTVGHRRTADEMGRIAERTIPDDFMHEAS